MSSPPTADEVCKKVSELKKAGQFDTLAFSAGIASENDELREKLGTVALDELLTDENWRIGAKYLTPADLDNDGVMDFVLTKGEGTANCMDAIVFHGQTNGSKKSGIINETDCGGSLEILPVRGHHYLVYSLGNHGKVQTLKTGKLEVICKF